MTSFGSARFIFVVVFVLNCVLWSQSRYGQLRESSVLHGERSLVKRLVSEFANPNLSVAFDNDDLDQVS